MNNNHNNFLHPIKIKNIQLPGNIFLAPLSGWSDAAFRYICRQWGADFAYTEMLSAEGLLRKREKTLSLLKRAKGEDLLGIQIFSDNPSSAALAVQAITPFNPTIIDLNCGCSIPKILKSGAGAALLKNPDKIHSIVKAMYEETDIPVTVKLRSGWDKESINYMETAEAAASAGAGLITLHPRTRVQAFHSKAKWEHIRKLKKCINVPVIGSGDLFSALDVYNMFVTTECDGVMVSRGSFGNPFLFSEIKEFLTFNKPYWKVNIYTKLITSLKHLKIDIDLKGEEKSCKEMRKHFCAYTKGICGSAALRNQLAHTDSSIKYEALINQYFSDFAGKSI
jgi:tRNA-dihydrouridine synthase B